VQGPAHRVDLVITLPFNDLNQPLGDRICARRGQFRQQTEKRDNEAIRILGNVIIVFQTEAPDFSLS